MIRTTRRRAGLSVAGTFALAALALTPQASAQAAGATAASPSPATPIKHLVVIFQENVSFDHYFGTYPRALNPPDAVSPFTPLPGTPSVNGLSTALLTHNPNESNPQRLDRAEAMTCDQDHDYSAEQQAFDHGAMDQFVQDTGGGLTLAQCLQQEGNPTPPTGVDPNYAVMDYFDGNVVTAMWQYAQHFSLSDNSYGTIYGPSTPGAINVTAGNTYGAVCGPSSAVINAPACQPPGPGATDAGRAPGSVTPAGTGTDYSDADPYYDVCSDGAHTGGTYNAADNIKMGGPNVGDLLDAAGVTWGWFQGGFASPGYVPGRPGTDNLAQVCTGSHDNVLGQSVTDYIPHHEPFQYYASTANPRHLPPTSVAMIGRQDQANHQYDIKDFWAAADSGHLPQVSYLKAPGYEDGHAGYSDPLDEQRFLASTIDRLEKLPTWSSTAVIINYDDSDGWYDHQMGPLLSQSQTSLDYLTANGYCGANPAMVPRSSQGTPEEGRCGVGPRLPMLVISPWARSNFVDDTFTDQTSIVKFIEDNWLLGRRLGDGSADAEAGTLNNMFNFSERPLPPLFLDPTTGEPVPSAG